MRVIAIALITFAASAALALIPPMSVEDLTSRARIIVTGEISQAKPHGEPTADHCYRWQAWEARVKVDGVKKGEVKRGAEVTIHYSQRLGPVTPERRCVGGRDSYHLTQGARYRLFLGGGAEIYHPFHRNGVKQLRGPKRVKRSKPTSQPTPAP